MPQHVRKGDQVKVLAGDDKNTVARVLRVMPKLGLVVVEGVNLCRKHVKPSQKHPQGGLIQREVPIHLSNVAPVVDGKATRVRFEIKPDGSKVRLAVRGGQKIGNELRKAKR